MSDNVWSIQRTYPQRHVTIVPSDTVDLKVPMIIVANSSGNIAAVDEDGTAKVYAVTPGYIIPVIVRRVNATSTTATDIIGLY